MIILIKVLLTLLLSILSGILGRMGGAEGYNTLYRDIGCSLISILTFCLWFGFKPEYWWLYLISFGLHWASISTYFDNLFGYDNLWFSGFVTGVSLLPLIFVYKILPFFIIRSLLLAISWGLLNKLLPFMVLIWRRDVAEEFLRYFTITITYLLRLIK
jgi:hypothetical protein